MRGEETLQAKLKHLSAQVAIDVQPFAALSHGSAAWGQQSSIGSEADITVGSCDIDLSVTLPAAGNIVTDREMRTANTVRPIPMDQPCCSGNSRWLAPW